MRMFMYSTNTEGAAGNAGSVADVFADQANDSLTRFDVDFGRTDCSSPGSFREVPVLSSVSETLTSEVETMSTLVS